MSAWRFALVGNPNAGKTAIFNRLTKSRQKTANYAGATVERKEGKLLLPDGRMVSVLDLPGAYSLNATSPDEAVTRDICQGNYPNEPRPDAFIYVMDATNLKLHLRLLVELQSLGLPIIVALNMYDSAQKQRITIDIDGLSQALGLTMIPTIAIKKEGVNELIQAIQAWTPHSIPIQPDHEHQEPQKRIKELLDRYVDFSHMHVTWDDKVDRVLLHPRWGWLCLFTLLFVMFQAVYSWAAAPQAWIESGFNLLGETVQNLLPEGPINSLIVHGIIAGCASVLVFLPQILILFAFILVLEESGYLPRAAYLLDPVMRRVGLSGRSFIPLLSSFACAVPGIMATRSIQHPKDRLLTIMIAPLMTCSARLPVYTLLIGAFIPPIRILGWLNIQGLVLFGLYMAGILSAMCVSWVSQRLTSTREVPPLLLELPAYRFPKPYDLALGLWERGSVFVKRVGSVILTVTVVLWALLYFPVQTTETSTHSIYLSIAGQLGRGLEYIFSPLGFNVAICIALIPGMAARELAVSSLATVYALSMPEDDTLLLSQLIGSQWSLATGLSLLVWYIYAPMCISTLATIRRETMSWKYTGIVTAYLFALAYIASLLTYQLLRHFT